MTVYRVLELYSMPDVDDYEFEFYEAVDELEEALQAKGYDYFIAPDPYATQSVNLIVNDKYIHNSDLKELCAYYGIAYEVL